MALYKNAYELAQKRKNKEDFVSALSEVKDSGTTNNNQQNGFYNNFNSSYAQSGGTGNGFNNLGNFLGKGLSSLGSNGSSTGNSALVNALSGNSSGSVITDAINGTGGSGSAITDAINSSMSSGSGSSSNGFLSKFKGGSSGGGVPWAMIGGLAKGGYTSISGKDDKDYSDTEESIIYPLQGASMGAQFGPWGALGGALYGLGYSFKDDLGLKDSNLLTQLLFPIGMGDGGGLRVSGNSVLDLG